MKKICALFLAVCLLTGITACGGQPAEGSLSGPPVADEGGSSAFADGEAGTTLLTEFSPTLDTTDGEGTSETDTDTTESAENSMAAVSTTTAAIDVATSTRVTKASSQGRGSTTAKADATTGKADTTTRSVQKGSAQESTRSTTETTTKDKWWQTMTRRTTATESRLPTAPTRTTSGSSASSSVTATPTSTAVPKDVTDLIDFIVDVPADRDPIVLQLTDPQIANGANVTGGGEGSAQDWWRTYDAETLCYPYIRETIEQTNPDLILVTGDMIYGEFDHDGSTLQDFIRFMDSFKIPWAPVFGNHDNAGRQTVDAQCAMLEAGEYCLFEQRTLTGNGNYTVGLRQDGKLQRVFFMMDSNGCGGRISGTGNSHTVNTTGFGQDQVDWFTETAQSITALSPSTKFTFAFHIQLAAFADAFAKYGFDNATTKTNPINIDSRPDKAAGDFGYLGRDLKSSWDEDRTVYNRIKSLGADSILVGHEHCNSASVVYDGIRFQYGQKCSTYDRANYVVNGAVMAKDNNFTNDIPILGGTVLPLSAADGAIKEPYIYYCENAGGNIDWSKM